MWTYPVLRDHTGHPIVIDVHDGDTIRLALNAGLETAAHPRLRVRGLYCPELSQPGGVEARAYTTQVLTDAAGIVVHVHGRSFGRWVAQVMVDGADLAGLVITAGHGTATP